MYSQHQTGRLKTRMRHKERLTTYLQASKEAEVNVFVELKKFLNELPLLDRIKAAFLIILGRF